jgi:hypothetical protein
MLSRQLCDKGFISIRSLAAQPVIEVRDSEHDAQLGAKLKQHAQQGDRIRATRHRYGHAIARAHELPFVDVTKHLFAHAIMVMQVSAFSHQPSAISHRHPPFLAVILSEKHRGFASSVYLTKIERRQARNS